MCAIRRTGSYHKGSSDKGTLGGSFLLATGSVSVATFLADFLASKEVADIDMEDFAKIEGEFIVGQAGAGFPFGDGAIGHS